MTASSNNLQPVYNLPILYKQGGKVTVASNTTLSVTAGLFRSSIDNFDINVGDYFGTSTATVINAANVGVLNGLDTGTLAASKVYAVWAIADQAGYNQSGYLLSLSQTAPVMPLSAFPSGYNVMRRVGWAVTDATVHFLTLFVSGLGNTMLYTYDAPVLILNAGTSATQAAVDLSSVVPAVANIPVNLNCDFVSDTAGKKATICPSGGTIASSRFIMNAQVASVHVIQNYEVPAVLVSSLPKVDYIISAATSTLSLYVAGFIDFVN